MWHVEGDYDCELVVIADGWKLRLVDPYGTAPLLYVRRPGTTAESGLCRIWYQYDMLMGPQPEQSSPM